MNQEIRNLVILACIGLLALLITGSVGYAAMRLLLGGMARKLRPPLALK